MGSSENEGKEAEPMNEELFEGILLCVCVRGGGREEKQQQPIRSQGQETNG